MHGYPEKEHLIEVEKEIETSFLLHEDPLEHSCCFIHSSSGCNFGLEHMRTCFEHISAAPQSVPCGSFSTDVEQICAPKEPLKYIK